MRLHCLDWYPVNYQATGWAAAVTAIYTTSEPIAAGDNTLSFDDVEFDDGWGYTSGTDFTVPSGVNVVVIRGSLGSPSAEVEDTRFDVLVDGAVVASRSVSQQQWTRAYISYIVPVTAGEVITFNLNSGTSTSLDTFSRISLVGYSFA